MRQTPPDTDVVPIYSMVQNRYRVFDHSGQFPFSIVYSLCRNSRDDPDLRPLVLDTRRSALDVPYGLAHGLLKLSVEDADLQEELDHAVKRLTQFGQHGAHLTLPSPHIAKGAKINRLVAHHYPIDPGTELSALFRPGRTYHLRLASEELHIEWHARGDPAHLLSPSSVEPLRPSETSNLIARPIRGKCTFRPLPSLPRPPNLRTSLRSVREDRETGPAARPALEVSVSNPSPRPVTIQVSGHHRFLSPAAPMRESLGPDPRPRVLFPRTLLYNPNLTVVRRSDREPVREPPPRGPSGGPGAKADHRPTLDRLVTIRAGETVTRRVDLGMVMEGLEDGEYEVRIEERERGCWWCFGDKEEFGGEGGAEREGRVPWGLWETVIPPVVFRAEEGVVVRVEGGRVVG